jgi:predicted DNA-binding WGR domain protein
MDTFSPRSPDLLLKSAHTRYQWVSPTRYYVAEILTDLFGDLVLARYWGGLGNRLGGRAQTIVASLAEAEAAIDQLDQTRQRRGYQRVA